MPIGTSLLQRIPDLSVSFLAEPLGIPSEEPAYEEAIRLRREIVRWVGDENM